MCVPGIHSENDTLFLISVSDMDVSVSRNFARGGWAGGVVAGRRGVAAGRDRGGDGGVTHSIPSCSNTYSHLLSHHMVYLGFPIHIIYPLSTHPPK